MQLNVAWMARYGSFLTRATYPMDHFSDLRNAKTCEYIWFWMAPTQFIGSWRSERKKTRWNLVLCLWVRRRVYVCFFVADDFNTILAYECDLKPSIVCCLCLDFGFNGIQCESLAFVTLTCRERVWIVIPLKYSMRFTFNGRWIIKLRLIYVHAQSRSLSNCLNLILILSN